MMMGVRWSFGTSIALVLTVGLHLGPVQPACAAPSTESDKQRATALLRTGAALMDRKDAAAALDKFNEAFRIFPSPKIQFNIASAYKALGRPAAAFRAFGAYLEGAKDDAAVRRREAAGQVEALRARVAFVEIDADVLGAVVLVDGVDEGRTPLPRPLVVDPGPHAITVEPPASGPPWTRAVRVEAGGTIKVQVKLLPVAEAPTPPAVVEKTELRASLSPAPSPAHPEPDFGDRPASGDGRPVYKKAWFWSAVAIGAAAIAGAVILSAKDSFACPSGLEPCLRAK